MSFITGTTFGGKVWAPAFLKFIDQNKCIGCGRCYKICSRGVMALIEKPFHGEDSYGDDMGNMVMSIAKPEECIGCGACARACTKGCHTHAPAEVTV